MGRVILVLIVVAVIVWLLVRTRRGPRTSADGAVPGTPDLVRCTHCGLHLPRAEARRSGERYFCSEEHARRDAGEH